MNNGFTITVDAEGVIAMLDLMAEEIQPTLMATLAEVSALTVETMKGHANVGATGELRDSIGYEIDPALLASEIKPSVSYGDALETGSKPHWAPIEPLKAWAEVKGLNPYAVRWSIAQKGTLPHPYIQPTYEEVTPIVSERFGAAIAELVDAGGLK